MEQPDADNSPDNDSVGRLRRTGEWLRDRGPGAAVNRVRGFPQDVRLYLIGTFLMGIAHGAVWVHMNLYYRSLGIGEATVGRILSLGSLGTVCIAIPAALLFDRLPASRLFSFAAVGYALGVGGQLCTSSVSFIYVLSMLAGMSFTVHWVAAAPFFMRAAADNQRLHLFGYAHAIETTATVIASISVGAGFRWLMQWQFSETTSMRYALGLAVLCALGALFTFRRIKSRPKNDSRKTWRNYLFARNWNMTLKLILAPAIVGSGAGLIIPFLNLYFKSRFQLDPLEIGRLFSVSQFFLVLGFLAGPALARRTGIVTAVVITELLSIPFFLMLAWTNTLWVAVSAFLMRGALMNMNHPLMSNFAMEMVDEDQRAVTNSLKSLAWNLSWTISTRAGGWMIENHGFTPPILCAVGLYLTASAFTVFFFYRYRDIGKMAHDRPASNLATE